MSTHGTGRPDQGTRERLLEAAANLFAQRGRTQVTIRDICVAAGANIAAVNYHFASKDALYADVVTLAISIMQTSTTDMVVTLQGRRPEDRIREFVRSLVTRTLDRDADWPMQIWMREIAEPTAALARLSTEVVSPQLDYLQHAVGDLLGCEPRDPRAVRCAFSIHAQCIAVMHPPIAERLVLRPPHSGSVTAVVDHITELSLAGLWALARQGV